MHAATASNPVLPFAPEPRVTTPAWRPPIAWRPGPAPGWSRLAAALLLLGLLVGSVAAILYPLRAREQGPLPVVAPAATAATPATQAMIETVFRWTLPEDLVPRSGNLDVVLWNSVTEPGAVTPILAEDVDCCTGPQISHVMDGALTLSLDGPVRIFHSDAGSAAEPSAIDVPPGTPVTLEAGDTAVYAFNTAGELVNHGSTPVHLIGGAILAGSMHWAPDGWTLVDGNETYAAAALPAGPIEATLQRAVLPPKASVPAPPPGSEVLEVGAFGDASIAQLADGGMRNIGPQEETVYILTFGPPAAPPAA